MWTRLTAALTVVGLDRDDHRHLAIPAGERDSLSRPPHALPRSRAGTTGSGGKERRDEPEQIPAPESRRGCLDRRFRFTIPCRAVNQQVDSPDLISIEVHLSLVLQLPVQFIAAHRVTHFRKPSADRLHTDLELQIRLRIFRPEERNQNHVEERFRCSIRRARPERNDVHGPTRFAFEDRERRTVVGARREHCKNRVEVSAGSACLSSGKKTSCASPSAETSATERGQKRSTQTVRPRSESAHQAISLKSPCARRMAHEERAGRSPSIRNPSWAGCTNLAGIPVNASAVRPKAEYQTATSAR